MILKKLKKKGGEIVTMRATYITLIFCFLNISTKKCQERIHPKLKQKIKTI